MNPAQKTSIRASTQNHLDIKDIQNNFLFLKNGSCCLVLQSTAINFGLLSEKEQEATIYAYAGFLNSLTFPVQIIINSRQKDISSYLSLIDQQLKAQKEGKIKSQFQDYRKFIEGIVQKNKILDKKFYIVISFMSIKKTSQENLLEKAKVDLHPKRNHLINQFQRLGLKTVQLNNQKLIEVFYNIYNPKVTGQKFVFPKEYTVPIVQSATKLQPSQPINQLPPLSQKQTTQTPTVSLISNPTPAQAPSPLEKPTQISPPKKTPTASTFSPYALNTMMPKQKTSDQRLEGQELQNKINNIVKKVAGQTPPRQNATI